MRQIEYSKLCWPEGLNLNILFTVLSERNLRALLSQHSQEERRARRIILPSHKTIKKVIFHYIWSLVENGEISWDEVKGDFKKEFGTLREANISKKEMKRLYVQRRKEILFLKIKEQRKL